MSENTSDEETNAADETNVADDTDAVGETTAGDAEERSEPEARSRRRALLILVIVVVVAVVAALIVWSVNSNPSTPTSTTSAGATPLGDDPSPSADVSDPADPAEPGDGGVVTDDIRDFDETAPVSEGVTVALSGLEAVDGEATTPGEIAGPSLRFTVTFTNDSDKAYSLLGAVTNVYYGAEQVPAIGLAQPGGEPFPQEVAPGETAKGTFIYNVPTDQRDQVRITVDYEAAEPALVFEGAAPK